MTEVDDFLEHYGVPGMKWGRRKSTSISKPNSSVDAKARDRIRAKQKTTGIHSLTNKQIEQYNRRMNLERNYKQLIPASKGKQGHDFVKGMLGVAGTATTAYAFAKSPLGQEIKKMFVKKGQHLA